MYEGTNFLKGPHFDLVDVGGGSSEYTIELNKLETGYSANIYRFGKEYLHIDRFEDPKALGHSLADIILDEHIRSYTVSIKDNGFHETRVGEDMQWYEQPALTTAESVMVNLGIMKTLQQYVHQELDKFQQN